MNDLKNFIIRCEIELKDQVEEQSRKNYANLWLTKNPEKRRECIRKYSHTEKGKLAAARRNSLRRLRHKNAILELSKEEMEKIQQIYINCPPGYEVDHIIPISKGGKHHSLNLQYLTVQDNRRKSNRLPGSFKLLSKELRLQYICNFPVMGPSWEIYTETILKKKKLSKKYQDKIFEVDEWLD